MSRKGSDALKIYKTKNVQETHASLVYKGSCYNIAHVYPIRCLGNNVSNVQIMKHLFYVVNSTAAVVNIQW